MCDAGDAKMSVEAEIQLHVKPLLLSVTVEAVDKDDYAFMYMPSLMTDYTCMCIVNSYFGILVYLHFKLF